MEIAIVTGNGKMRVAYPKESPFETIRALRKAIEIVEAEASHKEQVSASIIRAPAILAGLPA